MKNKQETEILNIGSPNLSCEKKLEDLRCFEREKDWTRDVNELMLWSQLLKSQQENRRFNK